MNKKILFLIVVFCCITNFSYSTHKLSKLVVANGGVDTKSNEHRIRATISETSIGVLEAQSQAKIGFWYTVPYRNLPLASEPTRQTKSITFYKVGKNLLGLKWTKGNGTKRMLIASQKPLNGNNYLTDGMIYQVASYGIKESNVTGTYVVYNDNGATFDVIGLTNNTTYYFRVFDYNGQGQTANYNLTSATSNPRSNKTLKKENEDMEEVGVGYSLNVYPNPAKDVLNIEMNLPFENAEIMIVDNEGREVYKSNDIKNLLNLDVSNFVNGTYHILVSSDDQAIYNSFVIER